MEIICYLQTGSCDVLELKSAIISNCKPLSAIGNVQFENGGRQFEDMAASSFEYGDPVYVADNLVQCPLPTRLPSFIYGSQRMMASL